MDGPALEKAITRGQVRVLDLRSKAEYAAGHIPGAAHFDHEALLAVVGGLPGQVAPTRQVAAALASVGIGDGDSVVAYDADNGPGPARVVWTLVYHGWSVGRSRVLDGGFAAWTADGRPIDDAVPVPAQRPVVKLTPPTNARRVDASWVNARLGDDRVMLLDARTAEEYAAGHIPGAIHMPWQVTRSGTNFLDDKAMLELYREALAASTLITYCDTGMRASLLWLTLKMLAHPDVRVYDGSWSEWSARKDLPRATGAAP